MILSLVDTAVFSYIVKIFKEYGIDTSVKLTMGDDPVSEFRRYIPERSSSDTNEVLATIDSNRVPKVLTLYTRSELQKNTMISNNQSMQVYMTVPETGLTYIRDAIQGVVNYNVIVLFDNEVISDGLEHIFQSRLHKKNEYVYCDYLFDDKINNELVTLNFGNVGYRVVFSDSSSITKVSNENGNLLEFTFSMTVNGLFLSPFVKKSGDKATIQVDLSSIAYNGTIPDRVIDGLPYETVYVSPSISVPGDVVIPHTIHRRR